MRYCLACRRFSGDGPLCTQCGRSFGGRLCNGKKRHLNPPDAQFCGHCGTNSLTDAAACISLGWLLPVLLLAIGTPLLWWGVAHVLSWSQGGFAAATGFKSPLVWFVEKVGSGLLFLFVFYMLSAFMPGKAGEQFRALLSKMCLEVLRFTLQAVSSLGRALMRLLGGSGK